LLLLLLLLLPPAIGNEQSVWTLAGGRRPKTTCLGSVGAIIKQAKDRLRVSFLGSITTEKNMPRDESRR